MRFGRRPPPGTRTGNNTCERAVRGSCLRTRRAGRYLYAFGRHGANRIIRVSTSAGWLEAGRRPGFRRSCRTSKPHLDVVAQAAKIDWLGQQCFSAAVQGFLPGFCVAVGGYHDDRHVWSRSPRLGQKFKAAHSRHVDVGKNQDQRGASDIRYTLQRCTSRLCELHHEPTRFEVVAEPLPKQQLHILLIVDDQDKDTHPRTSSMRATPSAEERF